MQGNRLSKPARWTGTTAIALGMMLWISAPVEGQPQLGNQLPSPRLLTVSPCGAKAGSTVEISWTGSDLEEPQAFLFSHPGIKATPVIPPPPPPPKEDPKKIDAKEKPDPKKPAPPPPPPPPITKFTITVAADVPPGYYDVRLVNKFGVSNPRVFVVGDRNEVVEKEPNNADEQAQRIELGTTINGAINAPTDVDYFLFSGKKGQRILIACLGASIDSRINPEIRLFDPRHREMTYHRPLPLEDGVLDVELPADGDYTIRLCQFTYTGGNQEYFYRLSVTTGPWIETVFPPMLEPGKATAITLYGHNLPGAQREQVPGELAPRTLDKLTTTVTAPAEPAGLTRLSFNGHVNPLTALLDGFEFRLKSPAGQSNPVLLNFAQAPVALEKEENDSPAKAQEITAPCEVAGRIDQKRDRDWFVFGAKKGDVYIIDLFSHRLGAPTDMYFQIRNLGEKTPQDITLQDDNGATLHPQSFLTQTRDPAPFRFVAPADGKFHILVASHLGDNLAGPQHVYRLRISPERPDFRLIVMHPDFNRPDACVLGQGGVESLTVYAERLDGFKGEIALTVEGLPNGVTCPPQTIGPNMKQALLVFSAADKAPPFTGEIKLKGTATINGSPVVREARPAGVTWPVQPQANIPTVTRLERQLMLAVRDKPPFRLVALDKAQVFHGDKVNVPLKLDFLWADTKPAGPIQIIPIPNEFPPGLNFGNIQIAPDKKDANLVMNVATNVPPGTYNIVFRAFGQIPYGKDPKKKANVNVVLPTTPLALIVMPKQVAQLSVANPNLALKLGSQIEVIVNVNRQFDYGGPFLVKLVLPPNAQGITADEIAIPSGQNQGKVIVRAGTGAAVVNLQNLPLQAQATIRENVNLNHELKININVTK